MRRVVSLVGEMQGIGAASRPSLDVSLLSKRCLHSLNGHAFRALLQLQILWQSPGLGMAGVSCCLEPLQPWQEVGG